MSQIFVKHLEEVGIEDIPEVGGKNASHGTTVANDWTDLTDGSLLSNIDLTETRTVTRLDAWTGTNEDGTSFIDTKSYSWDFIKSDSCQNWTSMGGNHLGGRNSTHALSWGSSVFVFGRLYADACSFTFPRLYCFEQ